MSGYRSHEIGWDDQTAAQLHRRGLAFGALLLIVGGILSGPLALLCGLQPPQWFATLWMLAVLPSFLAGVFCLVYVVWPAVKWGPWSRY